MNPGYYSYLAAALGFGFLTLLLLTSWRNSIQARLLIIAVATTMFWAALAARMASQGVYQDRLYLLADGLRTATWFVFLLQLLQPVARVRPGYRRFLRLALPLSTGGVVLLTLSEWLLSDQVPVLPVQQLMTLQLAGHVCLALTGLFIIEQLYRNTAAGHLWATKYLFVGAGGLFAYDLYLYSDALLFRGIDRQLWELRGLVDLAAVPLLALAAARNRDWSLDIFVSRDIVLNTTAVVGGGVYLLVMAAAGYYLREQGGDWGHILQGLFLSLAVMLLVFTLFSGQLRARLRVFVGKHFYRNKYDYRREWLRLTQQLQANVHPDTGQTLAIEVLAQIVDARAGLLWLRNDRGDFENTAAWNLGTRREIEPGTAGIAGFFRNRAYVINLTELDSRPDEYEGLDLPPWLVTLEHGWLVIPLFGRESMPGFIVLAKPLVHRPINWEDRDLLLTAARQVGGYLELLQASEALARARQFEVFNRLSAYMVHDLKNIAAELDMLCRNAGRHRHNPEFIEDALDTVATATRDIQRLLKQLRDRQHAVEQATEVDLGALLAAVVKRKRKGVPRPELPAVTVACRVIAERSRLENVLLHLVDNAQQATAPDGRITLDLRCNGSMAAVEIRDTGHGMDAGFIRDRLFRPFDTTKGNAGMGIGMYESREYVRQIGGDLQVESTPGKGTRVTVQLPTLAGVAGREERARPVEVPGDHGYTAHGRSPHG